MNKILKVGSYGSAIGIVGILAKPLLVSSATSVTSGLTTFTAGCFTLGSMIGVSGGAVIGMVVLGAIGCCVDIKSIQSPDIIGWIANGITGEQGQSDRVSDSLKSIKVKED